MHSRRVVAKWMLKALTDCVSASNADIRVERRG